MFRYWLIQNMNTSGERLSEEGLVQPVHKP
jgi:hypothetical protein